MSRVLAAEVQIITGTKLASAVIENFIADAHAWVNERLAPFCPTITETGLKLVEKYLAAYFISITRDPLLIEAKRGDIWERYRGEGGNAGKGMDVDPFLRLAMKNDPCGIISGEFGESAHRIRFRAGAGFDSALDLPVSGG